MQNAFRPLRHNFSPLVPLLERVDMIAWDCDGTAVDNEMRALDVIRDEFRRYVKTMADPRQVFFHVKDIDCCRDLAGKGLPEIRSEMSKVYEIPFPEIVEQRIMQRRLNSPEPDEVVYPITAFTDLAFFFKYYDIAQRVVTSSEPDRAQRYLEKAGVKDIFNGIPKWLFSGKKPEPHAHRAARESLLDTHLNRVADPKRTIGIEDSPTGVLACVNDGIFVIGHVLCSHVSPFNKEKHVQKLLDAGANAIIRSEKDIIPVFQQILEKLPEVEKRTVFTPKLPRAAVALG